MKLILSERELEIIKLKEYKRGWDECDKADSKKYSYPVDRGWQLPSCTNCGKLNGHGSYEVCQGRFP